MNDFKELRVYQLSLKCFIQTVSDMKKLYRNDVSRIISNQVLRSVSSISANIAEGYGRKKGKEYIHFLYIARGSTTESIDWYEKIKLLNYIHIEDYNQQIDNFEHIRAMLTKMINKLSD